MDQQGSPQKWIYHSHVTWNIYNFSQRLQDVINTIRSSEFKTNFDISVRWRLALRLREKYVKEYVNEICLGRTRSCAVPSSPYVVAHLKLTDNRLNEHEIIGDFDYTPFVGHNFLVRLKDDNITSNFDRNSKVTYKIECDIFYDNHNSSCWSDKNKDLNSLSSDLRKFYLVGNLTDLVLKVGNERFPVHSTIVKLRSPCVARLLAKNPDDTEIDLSNQCSGDELKQMIMYWYSGTLCKWPRGQASRVSAFLEKMEEDELMQYYGRETTSLSTILVSWVIVDDNNFRQLGTLNNQEVSDYGSDEQSWKLHFYPKGEAGNADYISLLVERRVTIPSTHPPAYLKIFFNGGEGKEYDLQKDDSWLRSPREYFFDNFMSHSEFNNQRDHLLSDNALVIGCIIQYGPEYDPNPGTVQAIKHPYEVLALKIKALWQIREMGDVTLETKYGKTLKAHSAILAARSRYFELELWKIESAAVQERVIKVHDIETEDLELILKYMYYADIDLDLELAQKLYPPVRKYKINALEALCSEYLQSHLNVGCALDVLLMADKSRDSPLKTATLQFVAKNFDRISKTQKWQSFRETNPTLAEEITSMATSSR